jgi:hypothetical protein
MKQRIVLIALVMWMGSFCPAVQAENAGRKTGAPVRPAEVKPGVSAKKEQAVPDSEPRPLTDMAAMALAVRKAKQDYLANPRWSRKWRSMTTIQQTEALAEYEARVVEWKKKPKTDYRGKKVHWTLQVEDVQPSKATGGYVLLARSKEEYLTMAMWPKERRKEIAGLRRGQLVEIAGTIEDYGSAGEQPKPSRATGTTHLSRLRRTRSVKPVFLGVEVASIPTFGVKLTDPKLIAAHDDGVEISGMIFRATNIIYLVDRSGSMTAIFGQVKDDLIQSVDRLSAKQRFQMVSFSDTRSSLAEALVSATPGNKARAKKFLGLQKAQGQTNAVRALHKIAKYAKSKKGTVVVLIMDGGTDDNPATLRAAKELGVPVHALLYGFRHPEEAVEFMKSVAKETKGQYQYVPTDR